MKQFILFTLVLNICSLVSNGQSLKGKITDLDGQPVPYSTVFVKEASFGTAANEDGIFEIPLKEGEYTCIFQCMGYQTITKKMLIQPKSEAILVVLPIMVYPLQEVVVGGGEDPAYRIMRKVIRKAPFYAEMVKSYSAEVYIRGSLNIRKISAMIKWMARDDLKESKIKEGDTYLEESVNEIEFTAPNLTRQKVKSIHSTFPGGNESRSASAIGFISGNIYKPGAFGNARSPLAPGAFNFYRFRYEGVNTYGDNAVYKIKIIPKGDGPQYVRGYLYIIEDLWCLYSLDITINEQLGMTLQLYQSYGEVRSNAWLPVNNRYKIDMDLMGNSGGFLYNTSIRYHNLVVNPPDFKPVKPAETNQKKKTAFSERTQAKTSKLDKKASELMAIENPTTAESYKLAQIVNKRNELELKDSLRNNHEFVERYKTVFDSNARKTDSAFWNNIRPIPLATNELKSVKAFDSIQYKKNVRAADSLKASGSRKNRLFNTILTGGRYEIDTLQYFESDGLLNPFGVGFNTVDGLVYKMGLGWQRRLNKNVGLLAGFKPGYTFSRKAFIWDAGVGFKSKGKYKNALGLKFGSGSFDFNKSGGAAMIENSVSTLFFRQNLLRLYRNDYVELKHSFDLDAGTTIQSNISFSDVSMLENHSDYSFFYRDSREFQQNVPDHADYRMQEHRDLTFGLSLSYQSIPYYVIKNGIKVPRYGMNNTPVFSLKWLKAIPMGDFYSDYDLLTIGVKQSFKAGSQSKIIYDFNAGYFPNKAVVYFDDFRHFSSQPLTVGIKEYFSVFQLSNYYRYSTDTYFAEGHFTYSNPQLLLKRLPLIRNRMWTESLYLSYIYTPDYKNFIEFGYGIGNYFYNVGIFAGLEKGKFNSAGFRVALSIFGKSEIVIGM